MINSKDGSKKVIVKNIDKYKENKEKKY